MIALADIERARERIRGDVLFTPCPRSGALSTLTGCEAYLKLENFQTTGSFNLARIIERGLVKAGRLVQLVIKLPDRSGALAKLTAAAAEQRANVIEIFHNRMSSRSAPGEALGKLTFETRGSDHVLSLRRAFAVRGNEVEQEG